MTIDPNILLVVGGMAATALIYVIRLEGRVITHEKVCAERQKAIRRDLRLLKEHLLPAHVIDEDDDDEERSA